MGGDGDRLAVLAGVHCLGHLWRRVVVVVAGLVVHHRAGRGAAGHRERRAAVAAAATTRVDDGVTRTTTTGRDRELRAVGRTGRRVRGDRDRLAGLDRGHRLGHLGSGVVVVVARLVVLHGAGAGAARHREGVADVEADPAAREGDESSSGSRRNRERRPVNGRRRRLRGHADRLIRLLRADGLGDCRRRVVVRIAGLVVLDRAGRGAAGHRERRAAVATAAAAREGHGVPGATARCRDREARVVDRASRCMRRDRDRLGGLARGHGLGHRRRRAVVRIAGLVVLDLAGVGAAGHRERRARVRADRRCSRRSPRSRSHRPLPRPRSSCCRPRSPGACVVTEIAWAALLAVTVSVTVGAAL